MHRDFRLFAAQNPSTGLFAGHRQELPESLTSRLLQVNFDRLPSEDMEVFAGMSMNEHLVHAGHAPSEDYCPRIAQLMVPVHLHIEALISSPTFPNHEKKAYAEITIRDLMKWCEGVAFILTTNLSRHDSIAVPSPALDQILFREAWSVYGARFRSIESRSMIFESLAASFRVETNIMARSLPVKRSANADSVSIKAGEFTFSVSRDAAWTRSNETHTAMRHAHLAVADYLFSAEYTSTIGVTSSFPSCSYAIQVRRTHPKCSQTKLFPICLSPGSCSAGPS